MLGCNILKNKKPLAWLIVSAWILIASAMTWYAKHRSKESQ